MRRGEWRGSGRGASSVRSAGSECWSVAGGDRAPGPEMRDGWWESDECQYCDGHWALLVCISLRLSPGPNQLQLVCCPAAAGAHSTLVTGQTRISGPERERDGHPDSASLSDDLNISQQSRCRAAEREREKWEESSLSFFLCPRNFQFSFLLLPQNLASSFLSFIATQTQNSQQGEETGGGFAKFYRIKPQRRLNWLCINLHHVIMAQARKNQVVSHEIKWYKSLKENFLGVCDIISCGG